MTYNTDCVAQPMLYVSFKTLKLFFNMEITYNTGYTVQPMLYVVPIVNFFNFFKTLKMTYNTGCIEKSM